ncbi:WYL domain-containing protein [Chitinibacter bivalviorum]|nr:WYL domain-containing protein [Chitinibacter bivalviorum]
MMSQNERFYRINQLLQDRKVVPRHVFLDELGISLATFKRDLEYLRDRLNAPIEYDRAVGGYRFVQAHTGPKFELPGLWFSSSEVHALLTMQHLLEQLEPSLLGAQIAPLLSRLHTMLDTGDVPAEQIGQRIRILRSTSRPYEPADFGPIAMAVLQRRQLRFNYFVRSRNAASARLVSPQRLVHYRDNWYLDAWCHERDALRSFSLDAIEAVQLLDDPALTIADADLDDELGSGYGIFAGKTVQWAELCFSAERARYVCKETWHQDQTSEWLADGRYLLRIPYSDERELLMDILRHGADVEVLAPSGLRSALRDKITQMQAIYSASDDEKTISAPALNLSPLHAAAKQAAQVLEGADALLITAGAGMGVDSGLPDFRGDHGFWQAYPALGKAQIAFTDVASPHTFKNDPALAWGFYGHRLNLYRATIPHAGFHLLREWGEQLEHGYQVYTSNVDGQFQKAGFDSQRIVECHGSIHHLQCLNACNGKIESADWFEPQIDADACRILSQMPTCPDCGALMRPNILMFGDWEWQQDRCIEQQQHMNQWLNRPKRLVIIEMGAGTAIATIRRLNERIMTQQQQLNPNLIRINPTEPDGPAGTISLQTGALNGLQLIQSMRQRE